MGKNRKAQKKAAGDEQICRSTTGVETRGSKSRKKMTDLSLDETGGIQPPNSSSGPNLEKQLPPDEGRCCRYGGGYRCKNFRMGYGASVDDDIVPKTKYCENHYNYYAEYKKKKKRSGHGDGERARSGPDLVKLLPPDEERCSKTGGAGKFKHRCKNFRMGLGASDNDNRVPKTNRCEKHYNYFAEYEKKRMKKRKTSGDGEDDDTSYMECGSGNVRTKRKNIERTQGSREQDVTDSLTENPSLITSNEQYCCQTAGEGWRCKNFRMSHGVAGDDASVPRTNYCEKHYNFHARYREKFLLKRSGDGGGADAGCITATGPVEIRLSKRGKTATEEDETGEMQPGASDNTSDTIIEGGSANISRKRKNVETTEVSGERIVESESLENYRSKCFESSVEIENLKAELKKKNVELEKLRVEYSKLKDELAEVDETSKSNAKAEDAIKYWKNKCSDLESLVLRLELENSTLRCEASRVSNFKSLVPRNGHENSVLRCSELRNSERIIESEAWGLEDGGGNPHLPNQTENVDERRGCLEEERAPQDDEDIVEFEYSGSHGGMHGKSEDSHCHGEILGKSVDSKSHGHILEKSVDSKSHGHILEKSDKMKWESEDDMASSFQEDIELCMKAVCALYRHEDEILLKRILLPDSEEKLRCTALAMFLMDGDRKGDLRKSVKDLEIFDSTAVADCRKLAKIYSPYFFYIYEKGKDPFSLPATTASHGDQNPK